MSIQTDDDGYCLKCGNSVYDSDAHDIVCSGERHWDGTCPMCGEPYSSYLDHLGDCPGAQ